MKQEISKRPTLGQRKTIPSTEIKERGEARIKSLILAQYDAFENRREDPNQYLGKRDHDYYWEAVGVAAFLRDLGFSRDVHGTLLHEEIAKECLEECKKYGCKKAYFKYNYNTDIDYGLTWDELVEESKRRLEADKPKPTLYTRIKNYFKNGI